MYTDPFKKMIKSLPFAGALLIAHGDEQYELVESNEMLDKMFDIDRKNPSGFISDIQKKGNKLSRDIIDGLHYFMNQDKDQLIQDYPSYSIVLYKETLAERKYLIVLISQTKGAMSTAIKNYESFYNVIDDMFLVGNRDGTILFSNDAVTKKLGYSREELKSMHMLALHPKEKREEAEEIFADMFQHRRTVCPLPLMKKDGQYLPVETRIWFGEWDGEERLFAIVKDLSVEQGNLQKFTKLFDCNPVCIAITSLETGVYSCINKIFLKTFGFSEDEIIGKTAAELGIIVDTEIYNEAKKELLSKGSFNDKIIKVRRKTGGILIGLFFGEIVESQGEKLSMTTMVETCVLLSHKNPQTSPPSL